MTTITKFWKREELKTLRVGTEFVRRAEMGNITITRILLAGYVLNSGWTVVIGARVESCEKMITAVLREGELREIKTSDDYEYVIE